jgi:ankyrin repeat protein
LERHRDRINDTFTHEEIYPPALDCDADHSKALHGTPLAGGGLLHLCVDNDEIEIARWLLAHGARVDLLAAIDADGFGGHTPLFGCVVSQPYRVGLRTDDGFARLLLDHGADPKARASLRKRLRFVSDETMREYRDVTPLEWGERFHDQEWVNRAAMRLIAG